MSNTRSLTQRMTSVAGALALAFGSVAPAHALDLLESYRLAVQQDANYLAARADTASIREVESQAFAQLLPNISANLSRGKNQTDSSLPGFMGRRVHSEYEYLSANSVLALRQPLYRKYNLALHRQSQAQVSSAEAALDKSHQDLLLRVSGAYFDALLAQDTLNLARAQKEANTAQLQAAKRTFASGHGTRTDVDEAQARHDLSLALELEASQNVDHMRRQLQAIINQPVDNLAMLEPAKMELIPPAPANPEEWVTRAEDVSPELRTLRANITAVEQDVEKARAGHTPTVDLIVQRSKSQSENQITINQHYLTSQVGLQVNIPIFSGGYVNSQTRQSLANLDKHQMLYEAKRRETGVQVRKEYQSVTEGILKVRALEQAVRSADQALLSTRKGYQAGTRTQLDILNAQQQLMGSRKDLAQMRYQFMMARLRLQSLVGSLDETEIAALNAWLTGKSENNGGKGAFTKETIARNEATATPNPNPFPLVPVADWNRPLIQCNTATGECTGLIPSLIQSGQPSRDQPALI